MRNLLLIIGLAIAIPVAADSIYRSVGEDGTVIFSDEPSPGAERIQKKEVPTVPALLPEEIEPDTGMTEADDDEITYTRLAITSPEDESIVRDEQEQLTVNVAVEPGLAVEAGHELVLYYDGSETQRGISSTFHLTNVYRGPHTLSAAVVDEQGQEVKRSDEISFTMLQHSALHPGPQAPGTMPGPGGVNPGSGN